MVRRMGMPELTDFESEDDLANRIAESFAEGGPSIMTQLGIRITAAQPGRVRFEVPVNDHVVPAR